jgi:anaerobic magnesium-protoporphyrin IX monomethyl ester cyclase
MTGDVCLIRPPAVESFRFSTGNITLPLGLAYIAAALEQANFGVNVIDAVALGPRIHTRYIRGYLVGLRFGEILARIPKDVDFIGITAVFTHEWPAITRLVRMIKQARPEVPVILGGEHVSAMPEFCLATCPADYLVLGEGEETIVELAQALVTGTPTQEIASVAYRQNGNVVVNPRRMRNRHIDDIPQPAWHLFDVQTYFEHHFTGGTDLNAITIPILATRGCPYQCTFCAAPNMWTPTWIARDPVKVVDEIEFYYLTYGARNFPFQDLTAIIKKEWIIAFCTALINRDIPVAWQFPSGTRSEAIDDQVADLLMRSNMINIAYAPESGSERTRKLIKKKMKTDTLLASIGCSIRRGLNVSLFMVLGFPHDTREDMKENLAFIRTARAMGIVDMPIGLFMALPGTQLFEALYEQGKVTLDPGYFAHILESSTLLPSRTYCEALSKYELTYWRWRFYFEFYGERMFATIRKAIGETVHIKGHTRGEAHHSRLETALRNGFSNLLDALGTYLRPRWMPKHEEMTMIEPWHALYRSIRETKKAANLAKELPRETEKLFETNVIFKVNFDHQQRVEIPVATAPIDVLNVPTQV